MSSLWTPPAPSLTPAQIAASRRITTEELLRSGVLAPERWGKPEAVVTRHFDDGAEIEIRRGRARHNGFAVEKRLRVGPNSVHAMIVHPDGSLTDIGEAPNLLTNIGRDWVADFYGAVSSAGGQGSPATASGATSLTATSTPWTASNLATPQLGLAGKVVFVPITNITTTPVYGLIVSNTTSVLTLDKWWTPDFAGTGTTPSSTAAFVIMPGRGPGALFMALTTDSGAASASDTVLASEISTNGGARAKSTYAHTYGGTTFTLQVVYTITGTLTAIHKMGLFPTSKSGGADPMIFEAVLNQDATVGNGDSLTVTDTVTPSG